MHRFTVLDSWRGVCALWVVLFHFRTLGHYAGFSAHGYLGVEFFFILSGFVIAHAYGARLADGAARVQFMIRRFGRLYPLHFVTFALVVAMECLRWGLTVWRGVPLGSPPFSGDTNPDALFANLTLTHGLGFFADYTWNVPSWSISVELFLYATFALVALTRRWLLVAAIVVMASFAARLAMGWAESPPPEGYQGVARGLLGFYAGVLIYRLFTAMRARGWTTPGWLEWLTPLAFLGAVLSMEARFYPGPVLCFAPLILIFAFERGPISRVMRWRPFERLGEVSYSIYMLHYVLVLAVFGAAAAGGAMLGLDLFAETESPVLDFGSPYLDDLAALIMVTATIVLANFTYEWVERPGRTYFNTLSNHPALLRRLKPAPKSGLEVPTPPAPGASQ